MDCVICHDGEDCEVNGICPNCGREMKDVEFQGEKYKQFSSQETAFEYREKFYEDGTMGNLRFCWLPYSLDKNYVFSNETQNIMQNDSYDYCEQVEQGCCGFMDEDIFIGKFMAKIGCNFGH